MFYIFTAAAGKDRGMAKDGRDVEKMQQIDGRTRLCGLIGNPVEHTMSPVVHNTLAKMEGRNLAYVPFLVEKDQVRKAVEGAFALDVLGLNVTVPYKSEVMEYLVGIDGMAEKIGAVNTLVRTEHGYKGYNTDLMGLYRAMCSEGIRIEGEEILILGAGGAARAAVFLCVSKGAAKVYILNRTVEKAQAVAEEANRIFGTECVEAMPIDGYQRLPEGKKYLAVQATSVGLFPNVEEAAILDRAFYERVHTGFDLVYRPSSTKFMRMVKDAGGKAYHGLKMLLYQGIAAYELWNSVSVSEEDALMVYGRMKEAMGIEE